jgi:hypothetical protein
MAKQIETILEWQAPEFRHYPKNAAWFITYAIIVALLVAYEIVQHDWFGAISIIIIAGLFAAFALHKPKEVMIRLTTHGLHIDDTNIPYDNIRHFWIVDTENHKTLNIETTAYLNHQLSIELHEQDPDEVQEILEELLPEHEQTQETAIQKIAHRFKF